MPLVISILVGFGLLFLSCFSPESFLLSDLSSEAVAREEEKNLTDKQLTIVSGPKNEFQVIERKDFPEKASRYICEHSKSDVKPLALWRAGIFDAQIVGSKTALTDPTKLKIWAFKLAVQHRYLSYAFGVCKDGKSSWVAAFPAPQALTSPLSVEVTTQLSANLQKHCREWGVSFAPAGLTKTKNLSVNELGQNKTAGVSGISCTPLHSEYLGPQLWFLMPTNVAQSLTPPKSANVKSFEDFEGWLNTVRKAMGLSTLAFNNSELNSNIKSLDKVTGLQHQMPVLRDLKRKLAEKNISLLGENKAISPNVQDAIWLLWNSPQHRSGLLNAHADIAAVSITPESDMKRLLLILAKTRPFKKIDEN